MLAASGHTQGSFRTLLLGWLNRRDCTSALADQFTQMAYARLEQEARLKCMEKDLTATPDLDGAFRTVTVPSDFLALKEVVADTDYYLDPMPYRGLIGQPALPGVPRYYARQGSQWLFRPYPTASLVLTYYGRFTRTVDDGDTNEILGSPSWMVLLWCALTFGGSYYRLDDTAAWEASYQASLGASTLETQDADMFAAPQGVGPVSGAEDYL